MTETPISDHPEADDGERLRLGLEFEVPFVADGNDVLTGRGVPAENENTRWFTKTNAELTYEKISAFPSTHGYEVRTTDITSADLLRGWYHNVYNTINRRREIEPCGYHGDGTAGLHLHLSPLADETAQMLYEVSSEPWMRLLACTSVAAFDSEGEMLPKYHVLRGEDPDVRNPCPQKRPDGGFGKRRAIADRSGLGHYEWRLPEPMFPTSFGVLLDVVMTAISDGRDAAREQAMEVLHNEPKVVTAILRARKIQDKLGDLPAMKDEQNATTDLLLEVM